MDEKSFRENTSAMLGNFKQLSESVFLIYEDLFNGIEKYAKKKLEGWDYPYLRISKDELEFVLQYYFKVEPFVKGFSIIASISSKRIRTQDYYKLCEDLKVDPVCPMLLFYGKYEPIDITRYNPKDWFMIFTGINNWSKCKMVELYEFGKGFEILTNIPEASYNFFKKGYLKIINLLEIKSQGDLDSIIGDLLKL